MLFATPINKLNLTLNDNVFYIKRDDLLPFCFGGNKARKAEYFLADIKGVGSDAVVTYGSSSSNHCRIIANMAAANNLKCYIISPEEDYVETSNSRMLGLFGASIIKTPLNSVSDTINKTIKMLEKSCNPYFIPGGGHGNFGTKAYADAYNEICEQEKELNVNFDYIFLASGTGTTQAGLVAGRLKRNNLSQQIVGISIARRNPYGKQVILDSLNDYFANDIDYNSDVIFVDKYICEGYGKYNDPILKSVADTLISDGIALNTTYTGKAFWGMKEYLMENKITKKNILFINTGGSPLFFDRLEDIK